MDAALSEASRLELRTLPAYRDVHRGSSIVVCGCGESLKLLEHPERCLTIGVNDVGRHFTPDYLVVVNPRSQFSADRFRYIDGSLAKAFFTQLSDLPVAHPNVVRFRLGTYGGVDFSDPEVLHYTQNSPYVAVCLAIHMGARRVGLLGVDFTDHHFFGPTGRHPLANRLTQIDREYTRLAAAARSQGVELYNLSPASRVSTLPRGSLESFLPSEKPATVAPEPATSRRVFFVTYRFLACGDVVTDGLRHAAEELGVASADAAWDDPFLPRKVDRFRPDLLFVVHGRSFSRRWGRSFARYRSAVWLLDEPYEVDDSCAYASAFDHVFVNDGSTLDRHRNAHYLPACYDPRVHFMARGERPHDVGFVGGANASRERLLTALAQRGLLSYAVGGPWRSGLLERCRQSARTSPSETADLYRQTRIVVNVFRDLHHFNANRVAATSLNPRIYEALACGALVISEKRAELATLVPELPTFSDQRQLIELVERLLAKPEERESVRAACAARLRSGTYCVRLRTIMSQTNESIAGTGTSPLRLVVEPATTITPAPPQPATYSRSGKSLIGETWQLSGPVEVRETDRTLMIQISGPSFPGSERGIASVRPYDGISLAFEVFRGPGTCFLAKINQADAIDQSTNSYHLYCDDRVGYLARHDHVFANFQVPHRTWERFRLTWEYGVLSLYRNGRLITRIADGVLPDGYAFLGVKSGAVQLRNIRLEELHAGQTPQRGPSSEAFPVGAGPEATPIHVPAAGRTPRVSIITTVYDRTDCLRQCIRSVKRLTFRDYEHIVVSDAPGPVVVEQITRIIRSEGDERVSYYDLTRRHNNWGIAPAAAGLQRAHAELVCFLSDDNGYLPEHLGALVSALDRDPKIGFAYSSCLYAGRLVLRHPAPGPGRIDLGQPLFRRELFDRHFGGGLPFGIAAWDWALVEALMRRGVRWKHIDRATFVFRLASYPRIVAPLM